MSSPRIKDSGELRLLTDIIALLAPYAEQITTVEECGDEWNPYDISGGNYDDAYYAGEQDGAIDLAKRILAIIDKYAGPTNEQQGVSDE